MTTSDPSVTTSDSNVTTSDSSVTTSDHLGTTESNDVLVHLARKIGNVLGMMHQRNIIHGDLTTSNLLLVGLPAELHLCLIDFGLGSLEGTAEDKAVDLYVLEESPSQHPPLPPSVSLRRSWGVTSLGIRKWAEGKGGGRDSGEVGGGEVAGKEKDDGRMNLGGWGDVLRVGSVDL